MAGKGPELWLQSCVLPLQFRGAGSHMTEELMVPFTQLKLFFLKILAGMSFFCMIRQKRQ